MSAVRRARPAEPVLQLKRIQGIAVPGFFKPHQALLCARYAKTRDGLRTTRALLREFEPWISSGLQTLADREHFRKHRDDRLQRDPLMSIAFTFPGLCGLAPSASGIRSEAFRLGLPARSSLLGDQVDPSTWKVGAPDAIPDFMIVIAGDSGHHVAGRADVVEARIKAAGLEVIRQEGSKHTDHGAQGREHFGFVDGISQPGIRGRVSRKRDDFVTRRHIASDDWPAAALYGYPGQELIWPGEFVLGYARSGPDPMRPGPIARPDLPWMANGSFLVYNRLEQDVALFWQTMRDQAAKLATQPGFAGLDEEKLAARLVGRYPDGAPVNRLHGHSPDDHPRLGGDAMANNHFRFDSDTPVLRLTTGHDSYPSAPADPLGMACPLAAHIRRVNPRDSASDMGGESAGYQRRILRVGVPFGPVRKDRRAPGGAEEPTRGLLFLSIQASIEEQFEFLQARWINDGRRARAAAGHDLLAGRLGDGDGVRRCELMAYSGESAVVEASKPYVIPTGGGYFFVPSLPALRNVLGRRAGARRATAREVNDVP